MEDDVRGKGTELRDIMKLFQDRDILKLFQDGGIQHHDVTANLYSKEEGRFLWNLALVLALKHRAVAFKVFYMIRSFITYNGIFMGPGYDIGDGSVWRRR